MRSVERISNAEIDDSTHTHRSGYDTWRAPYKAVGLLMRMRRACTTQKAPPNLVPTRGTGGSDQHVCVKAVYRNLCATVNPKPQAPNPPRRVRERGAEALLHGGRWVRRCPVSLQDCRLGGGGGSECPIRGFGGALSGGDPGGSVRCSASWKTRCSASASA